ncbi:MAG TPA: TetR family transcriptional regulator [Acidisarcina sp.]|nr:TetR family transcriptional regulator [Acidisarcina sp.]
MAATRAKADAHKQQRAWITRQHLIRAARAIFARDGYQHARLEDIAAKAGKTRGAFYANFKDKEDLFFTIFEEELDRNITSLRRLLQKLPTLEERVEAVITYLGELNSDRQRRLLELEFKMYAIRHPQKRKRLATLYAAMQRHCSIPEIEACVPELNHQNACHKLAVAAIMDGFAINNFFDPGSIDESQLPRYLRACLRESFRDTALPEAPDAMSDFVHCSPGE